MDNRVATHAILPDAGVAQPASPAEVQGVMGIERTDRGVRYAVVIDGKTIWERFVGFSRHRNNRAGGYDFVAAAKEQERIARQALVARALDEGAAS